MTTKFLGTEDVLRIHYALVEMFKGGDPIDPPGPRDESLLGSACGRPMTALGGEEKYTAVEEKAAALFHSLVTNHPFHNGNKRTALVATIVFLDENRRRLKAEVSDDEIFNLVVAVAARNFPAPEHGLKDDEVVSELFKWFKQNTAVRNPNVSTMRTNDFLSKCDMAGGSHKQSGGSWVVTGKNNSSVKFSMNTRQLEAGVVKTYVSRLGLSGTGAGIYIDEFQEGVAVEQVALLRLRNVLRRLADA